MRYKRIITSDAAAAIADDTLAAAAATVSATAGLITNKR